MSSGMFRLFEKQKIVSFSRKFEVSRVTALHVRIIYRMSLTFLDALKEAGKKS